MSGLINLEVDELEDSLIILPIKNLILDPTHHFMSDGIETCDRFEETECIARGDNPTTTTDVVTKMFFLALSMVLHCRCLHRNLLDSCAIHMKSTCRVILKLFQKKVTTQNQATK